MKFSHLHLGEGDSSVENSPGIAILQVASPLCTHLLIASACSLRFCDQDAAEHESGCHFSEVEVQKPGSWDSSGKLECQCVC